MPDLARYAGTVLGAYAVALALIALIVALSWGRSVRVRRRLAEVFGDVLPEQTNDDAAEPQSRSDDVVEEWLRREVPPHHGQ